jgi:valyl-tRNA synthetase
MNLAKSYEPKLYEKDIYDLWEKSGAFATNTDLKEKFSIVMPPPNANGNLHLGHALSYQIEDIIIRYQRLKGRAALLVPGADHAGFETWVVYEKQLAKEGKSRFDFAREELYRQVWDFVQLNKGNFESQLRSLGISCDWSRFTFTLDDKVVRQAYATFQKMWNEKLLYRGERLVNYCTYHGTSFSDIEVQYKDVKGKLWTINYPVVDGEGVLAVATTRPETMLGDTAIAVNPNDERYKHLVGKTVRVPLTSREIPVIADMMVETTFGTGAVKITPAHDFADFEVAERHDLPRINVIDHEGNIDMAMPPAYRGKTALEARELILEDLKTEGLLVKEEDYQHLVGHCYKCGTTIQPLIREQWFVDMKPLATKAIEAIKAGKITFYPESKKDILVTYLEDLRDWNVSRQIAWGIPIPAFQNVDEPDDWIFDTRVGEETILLDGKNYRRDPDVFDTWFSSGQWPYVTLNFPDSEDYKNFYPTSLMETAADILFQWVARMIMLGLYITGDVPFKQVYLHGLILDEHRSKMSKSKGNVVNPMEIIEKYGSDALRMGVITGQTPGVNQPFGEPKVIGARNFCNKLWNIARFSENLLGEGYREIGEVKPESIADHWLLNKLGQIVATLDKDLSDYEFSEAYNKLYHFVWDDLADWYIEASKTKPNLNILAFTLEAVLKIAHPFAPFLTETIWQTLPWTDKSLLISQTWPIVPSADTKKAKQFEELKNIITEVRFITKALDVKLPDLYFVDEPLLRDNEALLKKLGGLGHCTEVESGRGMHLTNTTLDCWLDISLDSAKKHIAKLTQDKSTRENTVANLQARLNNKSYTDGAPADIVKQTKDQLETEKALLAKVTAEIERFESATQQIGG